MEARQPACRTLSSAVWRDTLAVLDRRARLYGVQGARITRAGVCAIRIVASGLADPATFAATLSRTGALRFYGMGQLPQLAQGAPFAHATGVRCDTRKPPTPCLLLDGRDLDRGTISLTFDQFNQPEVEFGLTGTGRRRLAAYTSAHIGGHIAIVLDGKVLIDPTIQAPIPGGSAVLNNIGTAAEAKRIADELGSGELPVPLSVTSVRQ